MSAEGVASGVLFVRALIAGGVGGALLILTVRAILEREVEPWQGLIGVSLALGATAVAVSLAATAWYYAALVSVILIIVVWHVARAVEAGVREQQMLAQDAQRYQEAIELDGKNAAAHEFLADVYRRQGRLEDAVAEYEIAVGLSPDDTQVRGKLNAAVRELQEREGPRSCPRCDRPLEGARIACPDCGWSRPVVREPQALTAVAVKRALAYSALVTAAVVILSLVGRFPIEAAVTALLLAWLACAALFLRGAGRHTP